MKAMAFLRRCLDLVPQSLTGIMEAAADFDIDTTDLHAARKALGVESYQEKGSTFWRLPAAAREVA
jgi:hypothetical protein